MHLQTSIPLGEPVYAIGFLPGGLLYTVSGRSGTVTVWDVMDVAHPRKKWSIVWENETLKSELPRDYRTLLLWRNDYLVQRTVNLSFDRQLAQIALIGPAQPIEIRRWSDFSLVRVLGQPGQYASTMFDPSGRRLYANGLVQRNPPGCNPGSPEFQMTLHSTIFDLIEGEATGIPSPGPLSLHPNAKVAICVRNSQGSSRMTFYSLIEPVGPLSVEVAESSLVEGLSFDSHGSKWAIIGEDDVLSIEVFDFASLQPLFYKEYTLPEGYRRSFESPKQLAFHPRGDRLFCPMPNGRIIALDSRTGELLDVWNSHVDAATCVQISDDGLLLASAGVDGEVKLWSLGEPQLLGIRSVVPPTLESVAAEWKDKATVFVSHEGADRIPMPG